MSPKWRGLLLGLVLVPFWTNFLVRTIGWQLILSPERLRLEHPAGHRNHQLSRSRSSTRRPGVQIGVVYNYLPLMILPLFVAFDRIDPALREASKDLGANRVKTFMQVTMPLAMPGVIAGMLLVFIPLMGDYITAALLGGAKGSMAGHPGRRAVPATFNWSLGSAMAVIMILFILGALVVFSILGLSADAAALRRNDVEITLPEGTGGMSTATTPKGEARLDARSH